VNVSIISALAALAGAAVGGLVSGIANWLNHRSQVRDEWVLHEKSRLEELVDVAHIGLRLLHGRHVEKHQRLPEVMIGAKGSDRAR